MILCVQDHCRKDFSSQPSIIITYKSHLAGSEIYLYCCAQKISMLLEGQHVFNSVFVSVYLWVYFSITLVYICLLFVYLMCDVRTLSIRSSHIPGWPFLPHLWAKPQLLTFFSPPACHVLNIRDFL